MRIRNILCPVDDSDSSRYAADYAAVLARRANASLTYLHCYLPDVPFGSQLTMDAGEEEAKRIAQLNQEFSPPPGIPVGYEVRVGLPSEVILTYAPAPDLIVLGTHGRTGLQRVLMGSVAEAIVREADCPVVAVKANESSSACLVDPDNEDGSDGGGIACAVDANDYDQDVVDLSASLAREVGRPLDLVHVTIFPDIAERPGCYGAPSELIRDHQALKEIRTTCEGVELRRHHRSGSPTEQVLEFVAETSPRLLVLGTHGRRGLSRLLGSTASRILRQADCPVLVLRQHDRTSSEASKGASDGEDDDGEASSVEGLIGNQPSSAARKSCNCKCNGECGRRATALRTKAESVVLGMASSGALDSTDVACHHSGSSED